MEGELKEREGEWKERGGELKESKGEWKERGGQGRGGGEGKGLVLKVV